MTPTQLDTVLDSMTRAQLLSVMDSVQGHSAPAASRAADNALRSAIKSYLRIGRLTEQQILISQPLEGKQP